MPIAKVFFGMSLKREEEPQAVAVVKEDSERKEDGRKGTLEQEATEDVQPGQRRRPGRHAARGGKMRLRGKLGGQRRRVENSEKKDAEKKAKKQERREMVLALKLSRTESRKAQKEEAKRSRLESKNSESETKRGRFSRKDKERKAPKSRSQSRKVSRSSSKPRSSEERHLKVKKSQSESSKPNKKEKEPRFFKNRRDAKRSRSVSESARKEADPKGISKLKLTVEEKLAKRQARKEMREAKKAEAAEIKITGYISQEEPRKKRRSQFLSFSNVPRNPFLPKIRYGKIVHVPKAIRSMRAAAQRR